jgi:antitoxin YefM
MRTIAFTDARANLEQVIDQTIADADVTLITRRDAPNAVVMSQDHYDSIMETMHLLSSPLNAVHLAKSIAQSRAGKVKAHKLVVDVD